MKEIKKRTMFTKKQIQMVASLWETRNKEEIAAELEIEPNQVQYLASQISKAGYVLPRKEHKSKIRSLIFEALGDGMGILEFKDK